MVCGKCGGIGSLPLVRSHATLSDYEITRMADARFYQEFGFSVHECDGRESLWYNAIVLRIATWNFVRTFARETGIERTIRKVGATLREIRRKA